MTVVEGWFAGTKYDAVPQPQDLPAAFVSMFQANVAVNSSVGCLYHVIFKHSLCSAY